MFDLSEYLKQCTGMFGRVVGILVSAYIRLTPVWFEIDKIGMCLYPGIMLLSFVSGSVDQKWHRCYTYAIPFVNVC